jgi:hypothetical protein
MDIGDRLVVIARWGSPDGHEITLQDFVADGRSFIPIFSDEARFKAEAVGSGFENQGVVIDTALLASILTGEETLVLNPGSTNRTLSKADLERT